MVNLDRWVSEYCDANRRHNFPARPDIDGARGFMRPVLYAQLADNMEMTTNDDIFAVFRDQKRAKSMCWAYSGGLK